MNFNGGTIAELKKLIIPIMSHLPVMMIVAYHIRLCRRHDQASERGNAAVSKHEPISGHEAFVLFFFFWLQNNTAEPRYKKKWISSQLIILWKNVGNF